MDYMEIRQTYSYGSERNCVKLATNSIACTVVFYILLFAAKSWYNITESWFNIIQATYIILLAVCVVYLNVSIICKMHKKLKISNTEVHYVYGGLTKHKVSIPISTIRSCTVSTSFWQRRFGLATLNICAAGNDNEIYFEDIKDGVKAYRTIMDMIY